MSENTITQNSEIAGTIENIHLLRRLFVIRSTSDSPLHFGQVTIMRMLEENDNCTQAALAEQLNVTPASVATSTKRLQKAGFITKTVDKDNLRCKRLSLTEKGRETIRLHHEIFNEYDNRIFRNFSEEEKKLFLSFLKRLLDEMKLIEGGGALPDDPVKLTMALHQNMKDFVKPPHFEADCDENDEK